MPVIGIPVARLRALMRMEIDPDDLLQTLGHLGCDVEGYTELRRVRCNRCSTVHEMTGSEEVPPQCDGCGDNLRDASTDMEPLEVVRMELLAVRPDMFDPGGLARVLRGYLDVEVGAPAYECAPPAFKMVIDPAVHHADSYRPHIACAVVEDVTLGADSLKIIMKLQENLHWAIGRDRKHASIGVYDLDRVEPDLQYTVEDPDRFRFVPLGAPAIEDVYAMSLRGILESHPKGIAYAHLLRDLKAYPVLKDARGRVLSMPPVINSEETKVTTASKRLFVDVTGLGQRVVERTLNIIVTSLLEDMPGARLRGVEMVGPEADLSRVTPDFTPQEFSLRPSHAARTLGITIEDQQAVDLLRRMRHDARLAGPDQVSVRVPAYRNDILHEIDLTEDLAIAYGYHRITPALVPTFTVGAERPEEKFSEHVREVCCGLGYLEVMTLVLTNPRVHDEALGRTPDDAVVTIAHPVSADQTMMRTSLIPGLLATLEHNVPHPLPQRIFEVGDVTLLDATAETLARDERRLACAAVAPRIGFEDAKALAEAILREVGGRWELRPHNAAPFLEGRAAEAWIARDGDRDAVRALWFGEVHPEVLERFHLQNPTILVEGNLELLGRLT